MVQIEPDALVAAAESGTAVVSVVALVVVVKVLVVVVASLPQMICLPLCTPLGGLFCLEKSVFQYTELPSLWHPPGPHVNDPYPVYVRERLVAATLQEDNDGIMKEGAGQETKPWPP